jgi:membrane protease YdiL (CAAX protease family)
LARPAAAEAFSRIHDIAARGKVECRRHEQMSVTARSFAIEFGRVAWRLALYFGLLIGAFWLFSIGYSWAMHALGVQFARGPGERPAEAVGLGQARLLIAAILAWRITARVGRDGADPLLPLYSGALRHLLQGALWGLAGIAATIGAIAVFGGYKVTGVALSGASLAYYLPLWLAVALVNGLAENVAIMGYPLFRTARSAGWVPAMLLTALIFAAAHLGNPGENPLGIVSVFLMAVFMAAAIWLTGDLWLSVGIHAGLIIGEDVIFSVPDSGATYTGHLLAIQLSGPPWLGGGQTGPEGSIFALPIFALLLVALWRVYRPRAGTPAEPRKGSGPAQGSAGPHVKAI